MGPQEKQFGLRNRVTGQIVRMQEIHYTSDEEGNTSCKWLGYDRQFPYLQEDSIVTVMLARFGKELWGRDSYELMKGRDLSDMDDLDMIVFETTSQPAVTGHGDPALYTTETSRLEFRFVSGVRYQYPSQAVQRRLMKELFSSQDNADGSVVPTASIAILRSDVMAVASADLAGAVLRPLDGSSHQKEPMGVVDVRSADGVTYALLTKDVTHPLFHRQVSLLGAAEKGATPWDDCKVAFSFEEEHVDASDILGEIVDADMLDGGCSIWPTGWSVKEVDSFDGRILVTFRVRGDGPARSDGLIVKDMLDRIGRGQDPRQEEIVVGMVGR